ncbi:hypothetical protein CASFOL_028686 [Castilleja foliolosa]|uniref:Protein FAR1-RELATED SEQUENCE n=1 Tax=Castilleja foliolosa TaxID=1961234 RepID=A0ABD3CBZ0_9LAMI
MKTTSLSESVNSFFDRYLIKCSNLVEFFMQYGSAVEAQRQAQDLFDNDNVTTTPALKTPLPLEIHALSVYSTQKFLEVQNDITSACFECRVLDIGNDSQCSFYKIGDGSNYIFDVVYNRTDCTYVCSCKKFVRIGLLCSHIFVLFKDMKLDAIPDKYILNRWTKDATITHRTEY